MFASATTGRAPNFWPIHVIVGSIDRSYSQNIRPSAKKFFVRSFCFDVISRPSSDRSLRVEIGTSNTVTCLSEPSVSGFEAYAALFRFCWVNASLLTISAPPAGSSPTFVLSAAGFIATSTSGCVARRVDVRGREADLEARTRRAASRRGPGSRPGSPGRC